MGAYSICRAGVDGTGIESASIEVSLHNPNVAFHSRNGDWLISKVVDRVPPNHDDPFLACGDVSSEDTDQKSHSRRAQSHLASFSDARLQLIRYSSLQVLLFLVSAAGESYAGHRVTSTYCDK